MSIGSLGIVGGLAATPLSQRTAEADRAERDTADHARREQGVARAEAAAGIGRAEEDAETSERDADGRRPWEIPQEVPRPGEPHPAEAPAATLPKDPTGASGGHIDLVG